METSHLRRKYFRPPAAVRRRVQSSIDGRHSIDQQPAVGNEMDGKEEELFKLPILGWMMQ